MVFMGTETIAGTEPLHDAAAADLAEMKEVGSGVRSTSSSRFTVTMRRGAANVQKEKEREDWEPVPPPLPNRRPGQALGISFPWSLTTVRPRPQDHTMLVLWGHAYEFAMGHALTRGGV